MSGNIHNRAHILNVNFDITRILGFSKFDLVGQNIKNKILPKIFYNFHDELVNHYIDTSRSTIIGKERFVMPVNIEGYMVPSILMIKVLPTLDEGI